MRQWSSRLRDDLGVGAESSSSFATCIAREFSTHLDQEPSFLRNSSPVPLNARREELFALQKFLEMQTPATSPIMIRAQVVIQNYLSFVYLGDFLFKPLRRRIPHTTTIWRCCKFLTDNPVRAFRNAVAHGNWHYKPDFSGLIYFNKCDDSSAGMERLEVTQIDLNFWQSLARCTGCVIIETAINACASGTDGD